MNILNKLIFVYICQFINYINSDQRLRNHVNEKANAKSHLFIDNKKTYHIGGVLNSDENVAQFVQVIQDITYEPNILPAGITIYGATILIDSNPVKNTLNVCKNLFSNQVYAIIVDDSSLTGAIVFTSTFQNIPTIGISNRQSLLSDKNVYGTYMRTVTPYFHQTDAWIEMINYLEYNCVIFLHSDDLEGRTAQRRFEHSADAFNINIENIIEYDTGSPDILAPLEEAKLYLKCRIFILYANAEDSESIFQQINKLNMSSAGFVWIVSEQSLNAKNKPNGVLSVKLQYLDDKDAHIRDSLYILGMGLGDMLKSGENITKPPIDCSDLSRNKWESGAKLSSYLKKQVLLYGKTGSVAFDEKGDRINSDYQIVNVVNNGIEIVGYYNFSQYKQKMVLTLNGSDITWPGNSVDKPIGYEVKTHLRVATLAEKPFVWVNPVNSYAECSPSQIPCPKYNSTTGEEHKFCCEGYCIDLLKTLANNLTFTYSLYQVEDGLYGGYSFINGSDRKVWSGLVGDVIYDKADMVVAALTINPERSLAIEFTKPFKYQGITILEKTQIKNSTLATFLQPFEDELWVLIFGSVHLVALALYLLDRFSPFGRYKLPNSDITEEDALNLSSAVWFAWGVLLNSGIGEGTPRSFSGRVLGMVWAGFAMIVVASYTANLAAFLVLDRPETSLSGINDARLRSPTSPLTFATVRESAVDMYFKRQIELANMYSVMQNRNYLNVEEAIADIKKDRLKAFIWDSSRLEYEAANDCELSTSGELFGRSGLAIGLQKGSYWVEKVTLALLGMHEIGFMENLDNKWILLEEQNCEESGKQFPSTLGLKNMAGVFILVGVGIFIGVGLISFEIIYKKRQTKKQKRLELMRNAVDQWKQYVEKRRTIFASLNLQAKHHKYRQKAMYRQRFSDQNYKHNTQISTEKIKEFPPYTVEKGLNEIVSVPTPEDMELKQSKDKRRPILTRGKEFETFDFDGRTSLPLTSKGSSRGKTPVSVTIS